MNNNYNEESLDAYNKRTANIYDPKAQFLKKVLEKEEVDINNIDFLDVGCGSGYFVNALSLMGMRVKGIEVSPSQVEFANRMLGENLCELVRQDEVVSFLDKTNAEIVSFIGVLEHILNLHDVLNAIRNNQKIKYVYFSVPLFSFSVFIEMLSPNVYNRQLGGDHTHLFTKNSLKYMYDMYGWEPVGEWWFGTDVADLKRTVMVSLGDQNKDVSNILDCELSAVLDEVQLVIDKRQFCSEVHVLAKVK